MTIQLPSSRRATIIGALVLQLLATAGAAAEAAAATGLSMSMPGCRDTCGNLTVPYPFGIGHGCFREGFNLTCDESLRPPKLFLGDSGVEVLSISLPDCTVRILSGVLRSDVQDFNASWSPVAAAGGGGGSPFSASTARNWFVAFGCNIVARVIPHDVLGPLSNNEDVSTTCAATCVDGQQYLAASQSCSGIARCRTSIPWDLPSYGIQVTRLDMGRSGGGVFAPHAAVFIVDQEWFSTNEGEMLSSFSRQDALYGSAELYLAKVVPTVFEWSLDLISDNDMFVLSSVDPESSDWRCLSPNSFSYLVGGNYDRRRCNCSKGYQGNPYIATGCQDIDECQQPDVYPCHGTCVNMPGTYRCSSKKTIRSLPGLITIIAISAGFGLLFSLLGVAKITNKLKQRRAKKLRQKFFKKNHGLLLQQLISSNKDIAERMKIFNLEELEQATNKFDQNRILGGGGHGTVYKGILSDQRVVAIKKANIIVQREIDQFINEVVILSQTSHRNVVKLFGCCLETEVPLLVYEFISNGTLSYHLYEQNENPLSWKDRLRIALETARAIAYLHSAASISVFHRDIKSANILLTDTLTAKVSDFGASRSISIDETGILTAIQGTYGYLDPEYYYTSRLTEKSDVYSFGVILAELLTRVKPVFSSQSSESTSLASYFVSHIRDNRLSDILDSQIIEEGGVVNAEMVAMLTESCLRLRGEERPTMRQVETTLQDVQICMIHTGSKITRVIHNGLKDQISNGSNCGEGTRQYSLEKEFIHSSEIPR